MKTVPEQYVFDFLCEISALRGGEVVISKTNRRKPKTGKAGSREPLRLLHFPTASGFPVGEKTLGKPTRPAPKMRVTA